jgi:transcription initiation factor TFIID subunit 12
MQQNAASQQAGTQQSNNLMKHVQEFPYVLPPDITPGSPEAKKWLDDIKARYARELMRMETAKRNTKLLEAKALAREKEGKPLTQQETLQFQQQRQQLVQQHQEAKAFVEAFRKQQQARQQAVQEDNNASTQQPSTSGPAATAPTAASQLAQQSPVAAQPPSKSTQGQQGSNAAQSQARPAANTTSGPGATGPQQKGPPPGAPPSSMQQPSQPIQVQQPQPQQQPQAQHNPQQPNAQLSQSSNLSINAAAATTTAQQRIQQHHPQQGINSPQSAVQQPQSATTSGPPRPLSHQAAMSEAARSYSNGVPAGTMAHAHPSQGTREPTHSQNTPKMPIPKHLNVAAPQPVTMGPARPTASGGASGAANGVMGQPAFQKLPTYTMEGEGERVLSKKKLDELVRQVTGGGEGISGETLTPEVEDVSLRSSVRRHVQVLLCCKRFW